jgi:hypothetical protein
VATGEFCALDACIARLLDSAASLDDSNEAEPKEVSWAEAWDRAKRCWSHCDNISVSEEEMLRGDGCSEVGADWLLKLSKSFWAEKDRMNFLNQA